jgi:hypothetical protein
MILSESLASVRLSLCKHGLTNASLRPWTLTALLQRDEIRY